MADFPNRINELRRKAKLSQLTLGEMAGCSKMHISGLERGERELSLSWMRAIARALGVSPADLLNDDDNPGRIAQDEADFLEAYRRADDGARETLRRVSDAVVPFTPRDKDAA